jgi:hypothetical protein
MALRGIAEAQSFYWNRDSDLHYLTVASPLMPLKKAILGLLALVALSALVLFPFEGMGEMITLIVTFFLLVAGGFVACQVGYWELFRRLHKVKIDGYRLEVTTGVLWKATGSVHLLPHTTFYIVQKSYWDVLFGLADVNIHPAMTPEPEIVSVYGLPLIRAHQFKSYLTGQIDKQLGTRSRPSVEKQMKDALKRITHKKR